MATLTDTGPLVALIDQGDEHHNRCMRIAAEVPVPLVTTWPCFTEAMYLLGSRTGWTGQQALWMLVSDGIITLHSSVKAEEERMKVLMEQYRDRPMDLADASLVATAEAQRLHRIFTFDSDFQIYRLNSKDSFEVLPG
jgi:predicted nucleic acid-binding protein